MSVSKVTVIIGAGILGGGVSNCKIFYLTFAFKVRIQQILLEFLYV
jgi:hypothetical protein